MTGISVPANLEPITRILRRTLAVLRALLDNLPEELVGANYGEGTFSPFDVLGHLIHGERTDWLPRMEIILEQGDARMFEPFDRYAMFEASRSKTIEMLLDEFRTLRETNLSRLRSLHLCEADLDRTGRHPELGVVTLAELLHTWTVHDLHHLAQICKAMAWQSRDAVGPWREYLSILNRRH